MSGSSGLRKSPSRHHKSGAESPRNTQVLQEPRAVEQTNDNPKTRPALLPVILITAPKSPSLPPTKPKKRRAPSPDSDLEAETGPPSKQRKMPSKKPSSSEKHSSKSKPKTDDWADVMEPEERRRIQNRIAQRKFRESPLHVPPYHISFPLPPSIVTFIYLLKSLHPSPSNVPTP